MHTKNAQGVPNLEDGSYKKFFFRYVSKFFGGMCKTSKA